MRIYISLQNAWYGKNLEPVILSLLHRGHEVIVGLCEQGHEQDWLDKLESSARNAMVTSVPDRRDRWTRAVEQLRHVIDYLHFLGPAFDSVPYSRLRRRGEVPELACRLIRRHQLRYGWRRRAAIWWLKWVDESVPPDAGVVDHFREHRPDVLVVCPLLGPEIGQYEHVRAAKYLGIPTVYAVHSWDNLSSKGLVRMKPECIAVWNEIQKREAVELHHQPKGRIVATGAYPFDAWFETKPSLNRTDFLKILGLPEDRPLILYLCSALYFAKSQPEGDFVRDWLVRLRACDDLRISEAGVMIRPHPKRAGEFADRNLLGNDPLAVVWPSRGEMPNSAKRHGAFFDSLYHADAVVGLNTSAMIEAAIVGRPVHTILETRYDVSQQSTFHFSYLSDPKEGFLRVATSWEMHLAQLRETLSGSESATQAAQFVDAFVRPHCRERKASVLMSDEIERTARRARVLGLSGALLRRFTLSWLERMQSRAVAADAEVRWKRCQTLEQWQERRQFLDSLERVAV
jgi:hypothetical protein